MLRRRTLLSTLLLRTPLAAGLAGAGASVLAQTAKGDAFRVATWEELVPKDWDPFKAMGGGAVAAGVGEGSAKEMELMREMRRIWDNAPTRKELEGAKLKLPGYVVPLESAKGAVTEFLLVPYFGACVHSPPPPANQIVHVRLPQGQALKTMDAVWASGTMNASRVDSQWGTSGYSMQASLVEAYKPLK